jgi:uncharacterized protein (TIGR03382 family)
MNAIARPSAFLLFLFLVPAFAHADVPGGEPAVAPECPRGTRLTGPYRYWYCEPMLCGAAGECPAGFACADVGLIIDGDRAAPCDGAGCPQVRACVRTEQPAIPAPMSDPPAPPPETSPVPEQSAQANTIHEQDPGVTRAEDPGWGCNAGAGSGAAALIALATLVLVWRRR